MTFLVSAPIYWMAQTRYAQKTIRSVADTLVSVQNLRCSLVAGKVNVSQQMGRRQGGEDGGRYRYRTCGLFRVKEALYH